MAIIKDVMANFKTTTDPVEPKSKSKSKTKKKLVVKVVVIEKNFFDQPDKIHLKINDGPVETFAVKKLLNNYLIAENGMIFNPAEEVLPVEKIWNSDYEYVTLQLDEDIIQRFQINRLVAMKFVKIPAGLIEKNQSYPQLTVTHIDGDKKNCHAKNLIWTARPKFDFKKYYAIKNAVNKK